MPLLQNHRRITTITMVIIRMKRKTKRANNKHKKTDTNTIERQTHKAWKTSDLRVNDWQDNDWEQKRANNKHKKQIQRCTQIHKSEPSHLRVNNWQDNDWEQILTAQHLLIIIHSDFDHQDDYHDKIMTLWWDYDYHDDSDDDYVENTKMVKAFFIWGWGQNSMQLG